MIIDKLIKKIVELKNPTVVGLDPRSEYIPSFILKESFEKYGETLKGMSDAFYEFNKKIIDEVYDLVPAVKPQVAMYEQYGFYGMESYIKTIAYAKEKGLIVIGDIKRSDIQSTAEAYSDGHIGVVKVGNTENVVYDEDFITLNPYLGYDSIQPYLSNCKKYERGIFVLVKTSNPNSGEIQDLVVGTEKIYEKVGKLVSEWGTGLIGESGFSEVCAVVGATHKEQAKRLREIMPHTFFLVPGYGAQGGKAEDLAVCFNENGLGAIVNSSRGIIAAHQIEKYKNKYSELEFAKASRAAVIDMQHDLTQFINL